MNKSLIINQIKNHLEIKTDKDFAKYLGINPTTLSMWHKRNTYDAELLFTKCDFLNAETLLLGKGEVFKNEKLKKSDSLKVSQKVSQKSTKTKSEKNVIESNGNKNSNVFSNKPKVKKTLPFVAEDREPYGKLQPRKVTYNDNVVLSSTGAPLYNIPVSAGALALNNSQEIDSNSVTGFIDIPGVCCKAYFPVIGFSFKPTIMPGDFIGVSDIERWERLDPDCIYFIITINERMIKHLRDHPEDDSLLICISPNLKEFTIPKDEIKEIYKVVIYFRLT